MTNNNYFTDHKCTNSISNIVSIEDMWLSDTMSPPIDGLISSFVKNLKDQDIQEIKYQNELFETFKKDYDHFNIFHDISAENIEFFSFLNFLRYYCYLYRYLKFFDFQKTIDRNKILSINFESRNQIETNLLLTFQCDGIVRFLSLDKDTDESIEYQSYVLEGNFSSSSSIYKNYKIRNLMSILDASIKKKSSEGSLDLINKYLDF